jgi:L-alanine-DL-glutamate epimerase-like enolase superfamily enzyme
MDYESGGTMKITNINTHLLTAQWVDDPWFPQLLHATALVEIESDAQLSGFGEITLGYFAPECVPPMVEFFRPVLMGRDPHDRLRLTNDLYDEAVWWARSGAGRSVMGGIETALWDLQGKALNVPVYQLLGGSVRDRIPVYASGGATCWPKEENLRKVGFYAERGYRATKLSTNFYELPAPSASDHQGRLHEVRLPFVSQLEQMVALFEQLRREFGAEMDFAIDGHQGGVPNPIPASEAAQIDNALACFRLRFYEEPLSYSDVEGYAELRARSAIPIAGGESLSGLDQFHVFLAAKAFHIVQPDLGFVGGIQETLRIIHHAQGQNISMAFHTGASVGPAFSAAWHMAAACPSTQWLEHVVAARSVQNDLLADEFCVRNGTVGLPQAPGLGVRLNAEILQKYKFVRGSGERT